MAHIALTALITAGVALLLVLRLRFITLSLVDSLLFALVVGCSVFIGFYAAFRRPVDTMRFEQARVLLTLVSFIVNVVTI